MAMQFLHGLSYIILCRNCIAHLEKSMWAGPTLRGDPKGTISEFKLFMFTQIPLKIIGVPDLPYIV